MSIRQSVNLKLIALLVQPFAKEKPVEFRSAFRDASRFLVLYNGTDTGLLRKTLSSLQSVFPRGSFNVLRIADATLLPPRAHGSGISETAMQLPKQSYWTFTRSAELKTFIRKRFDVFLDLDSGTGLVGAYLCRAMRIPLRIGLAKPHSDQFYNFVYKGKSEASGDQKISGLIQFLKSFVSTP